jgi:hypothetical protein
MTSTSIRIDTETRDLLRARGQMGESYDDVLRRLLAATATTSEGRKELPRKPATPLPKALFAHQDRG